MSSRVCGIAGRTARSSPTRQTGRYIDPDKVRPLNHKGRFFQVKGPINMARCPQGHPVIIEAGGSPSGLELAARTADVVFSVVQELEPAKKAYADLKGRMAKYGRAPDEIAVLPGMMPIIGRTQEEAREKLAKLQSWLTPTNAAVLVASRIGYDVSRPSARRSGAAAAASFEGGRTFTNVLYERARRENMTLRDLYNLTAAARGHWVVCGTPRDDRRHARRMVRRGRGRRLQRPAAVFPRRVRRFCRSGRAGIAAPRPVPPGLRRHDLARPFRPAGASRPRPPRARGA